MKMNIDKRFIETEDKFECTDAEKVIMKKIRLQRNRKRK